jgi:hypothetical protein
MSGKYLLLFDSEAKQHNYLVLVQAEVSFLLESAMRVDTIKNRNINSIYN